MLAFTLPQAAFAPDHISFWKTNINDLFVFKPFFNTSISALSTPRMSFLLKDQFIACRRLDRSADVCGRKQTSWADSDGSVEAGESVRVEGGSHSFPRRSHSQASMSWVENLSEMV